MPLDPTRLKLIQSRDELKSDSSKVGKAVYDILSKEQSAQEVGETLEMMAPDYVEELKDTIRANVNSFEAPFHVVVLGKKEPWAMNVIRHWFVARQTCPTSQHLMDEYPNHFHEVFEYDERTGDCKLLWALPAQWCHQEILMKKDLYHPTLIRWISNHYAGKRPSDD